MVAKPGCVGVRVSVPPHNDVRKPLKGTVGTVPFERPGNQPGYLFL